MKRFYLVIVLAAILLFSVSCQKNINSHDLLEDFLESYGAEGIVYYSGAKEGEHGYITAELFKKIYVYSGNIPENYAIYLNAHADATSECGVFVIKDELMRDSIEEMCLERIRLLTHGDGRGWLGRYKNTVFYSTMTDPDRVKDIWKSTLKYHAK